MSQESLLIVPEQDMPRRDAKHGWLHSHPPQALQKPGLLFTAPTSASCWDHARVHHMGDVLESCLWRGQLSWEQRFDEDDLNPFQELACREAWGEVDSCPTSSPFPAMWLLMQ